MIICSGAISDIGEEGFFDSRDELFAGCGSFSIAMIYHGLAKRDETLAWLERGYQQRAPRKVFLKADAMWNDLRGDLHFQDLLRRVGLAQ